MNYRTREAIYVLSYLPELFSLDLSSSQFSFSAPSFLTLFPCLSLLVAGLWAPISPADGAAASPSLSASSYSITIFTLHLHQDTPAFRHLFTLSGL